MLSMTPRRQSRGSTLTLSDILDQVAPVGGATVGEGIGKTPADKRYVQGLALPRLNRWRPMWPNQRQGWERKDGLSSGAVAVLPVLPRR